MHCHVIVDGPPRHQHQGGRFEVRMPPAAGSRTTSGSGRVRPRRTSVRRTAGSVSCIRLGRHQSALRRRAGDRGPQASTVHVLA
jgi:hypothetical protein